MNSLIEFYNRHHFKIILLLTTVISLTACVYYFQHGLVTAYPDAKGHLNIARRVFDNITPGFAQLGGVWLPLFHILMLPTIWNDYMWHSGFSGAIVSMIAYIACVYFTYKLVYLITESKGKAFIAFSIIALNINLLFLQSSPMTESLFMCTLVMSVYFLLVWARKKYLPYLLVSGFFFFLSSINRYEGWFVAAASVFVVGFISYFKKGFKSVESNMIIFATVALFGMFMWFVWQAAIFNNPIYFLNSDFSAKGQTLISIEQGTVPTYKNIPVSILTAYFSLVHVNGIVLLVLAVTSLIFFTLFLFINRERREKFFQYTPLYLLFVPFVFLVLALYRGNIPVTVPEFQPDPNGPPQFFNIRYALYTLPALAIFATLIPVKNRFFYLLLFIIVNVNSYLLLPLNNKPMPTMVDARVGDIDTIGNLNRWVKKNYHGGYILVSAATSDPIIFGTGLDMKNFITEGSGKYWKESMAHPDRYATWIIIADSKRDMVDKYMNHNNFHKDFTLVKNFGTFKVYKSDIKT